MAHLKSVGTTPLLREAFMMTVIGLRSMSMFCLRMLVGIGSRSHDFELDEHISFLTKDSHTGEKQSSKTPS